MAHRKLRVPAPRRAGVRVGTYGALAAAVSLAVGGCARLEGSQNASGTGPSDTASANSAGASAFVFATGTGSEPKIYAFIDSARTSLDMTMYELSDATAVQDLIGREKTGVKVRVVLDQAEKATNLRAYNELAGAGVGVAWSSTAFAYTHQKTITVDDREAMILTGNLTSSYYAQTRDYGALDSDPRDVAAIVAVFDADYTHTSISPSDADDLLWSPTTAQDRLLAVIDGATKTVDVEGEEFSDRAVVDALVERSRAGVAVRVVVESPSQYRSEIAKVVAAGGHVVGYSGESELYIHAKAIIADAGLPNEAAELGSMNFTANSLERNRELGIVLRDAADCSLLEQEFQADFTGGAAAQIAPSPV